MSKRAGGRRKALGQHFLVEKHIAEKIVEAASLSPQDFVVEVGPGKGILTEIILSKTKKLIVIEIDPALAADLKRKFPELLVKNEDARKFNTKELPEGYKLISNLPYSMGGEILRNFITSENPPSLSVVTLQKEVAERIASSPGKKSYGYMTVLFNLFSEAEKLFDIKPGSFRPPPKVTSTVLRLRRKTPLLDRSRIDEFLEFSKLLFNMRRKKLKTIIKRAGMDKKIPYPYSEKRPEEIGLEELIRIYLHSS